LDDSGKIPLPVSQSGRVEALALEVTASASDAADGQRWREMSQGE
jgi:hypothetical protein